MDEHDQATRIVLARLHGTVMRHAGWEPPGPGAMAAAVADVRAILKGRDDGPALLAETAGLITGYYSGWPVMLERAAAAAAICVAAGADEALIDGWACIGQERAERAALPPMGTRTL